MYTNRQALVNDYTLQQVKQLGLDEAAKLYGVKRREMMDYVLDATSRHIPEFFDTYNLKIRNKPGQLVSLVDNFGQKKLQQAIDRQALLGKPVRIKMPKARQFGGSTKVQANFFGDGIYSSHIQVLTVCHELDSAKNMRSMFERFYQHYPRQKPILRKGQSDKWWRFPERDVDYLIDTADELDTGRSFTIHRLHCSEVAFYRDSETLMTGLMQSVPDDPNTIIILESTANGWGGWWYDFVMNNNDFERVFIAWWEIEEYRRGFESEKEKLGFEKSLSAPEKAMMDQFTVDLEQLAWRRYTIENKLNGDEDKFKQEYPSTLDESFLTSGRPYFSLTLVRTNLLRTEKIKPQTGFLEWKEYGKSVEFIEDRQGFWKIFEFPKDGWFYRYVTGSDSAEGKIVRENSKEPDNSVCVVLDRIDRKEAARFVGRIDTDVFANEIYKASLWYGSACDAVERNSSGIAVIDGLKHKDNIYLFQRALLGKTEDKETVEYGFQTNAATRDFLLSELRTRIRKEAYASDDADFWRECSTFVYDEKGKPQGQRGTHDDCVFSAALAVQADLQAAEVNQIQPPPEKMTFTDRDDIWERTEISPMAIF